MDSLEERLDHSLLLVFNFFISVLRISQQLYWSYSPFLEVLPDLPTPHFPMRLGCSKTTYRMPAYMACRSSNEIWRLTHRNFWISRDKILARLRISIYIYWSHQVRKFLLCVTGRQTSVWKGKRTRYLSPGPSSHLGNICSSGSGRSLIEMQKPKVKAV